MKQGVSVYSFQAAGNMLAVIGGLIAAALYGNIGIKVMYNNIFMDLFDAPPLTTKTGKILYACIVPVWWSIGFIIAASIPDYFGFVSVISATTVLQFSYTFPPLLALAYDIRKNAMDAFGGGFDPATGQVTRQHKGVAYWMKGFMVGAWYMNVLHVLYGLGALAMAGLGMYAAVQGM